MSGRRFPGSMRGRLVAAIVLVAALVLAASFFALHEGTGADLNREVDQHLRADAAEFADSPAAAARTVGQLERRARRFVADQGYHGDSRIFAIAAGDGGDRVVSNEPDLIHEAIEDAGEEDDDDEEEDDEPSGILGAAPGLATIDAPDGGSLRVLTEPVGDPGEEVGTFRVAQSLSPVDSAQGSLSDTLLVVGAIATVVLVVAAFWIATLAARPLRRIATFAADLDTRDLDRRLDEGDGPTEVRSLAHSFNRMLDRLQGAFEHEREFVADASHELRTPVTIAQGELDLLRRTAEPAERERLDVVRRELKRMERLVAEMLTLASQDVEGSMRRDRVPVADLLADVRRDAPLLGAREYVVDELSGTVEADPDRIAQVFRNLLANAVAHTAEGGRIHVAATATADRVRFEIADDGPGFTAEEASRLFDRFYRTEAGRARDARGSGLGLAIARSIVEMHGGSIQALPATGSGGLIVFELPGYRA